MVRYIDADALVKAIDRKLLIFGYTITVAEALRLQENVFRQMIDAAPTADVVPRAEVEDWQAIAEGYQKMFEDSYERHQAELAKTKAEVAAEIFAEIEKYLIFNTYGIATISEKTFAELKKKYTEGE